MGIRTLAQFRSDGQLRARRTLSDQGALDRIINDVIRDVAATDIPFIELDSTQSLSLVISQAAYNLPSDWYFYRRSGGRITGPDDEDRGRVRPETRTEFLGRTDFDVDAKPKRYHAYGAQVIFNSPADKAYTVEIDYRKRPATLVNDGDVSPLPAEWDEGVVLGIAARLYAAFQEHDKFLVANNDFVQFIRRRTPQDEQEKFSPTPLGVAWDEEDLT